MKALWINGGKFNNKVNVLNITELLLMVKMVNFYVRCILTQF